jgi:hypothetical protein
MSFTFPSAKVPLARGSHLQANSITGRQVNTSNVNIVPTTSGSGLTAKNILICDTSSQPTPGAGKGRVWVRDDTPNVLVFTDDVGTDTELGQGGIAVSEEGVSVGTGFAVLDFIGSAVTATDAGSGVASITVAAGSSSLTDVLTANNDAGGLNIENIRELNFDTTTNGISIGTDVESTNCSTASSICIGKGASCTTRTYNVVIGFGARSNNGNSNVVLGHGANHASSSGVAIGINATTFSNRGIAIGSDTVANGASDSMAMGNYASSIGAKGIAIGAQTDSNATNSIAIGAGDFGGDGAYASGIQSIAIGRSSMTTVPYSVALGASVVCRVAEEFTTRGVRSVRSAVNTTDTTLTTLVDFPINTSEIVGVDVFLTEENTEGTIGTAGDTTMHFWRDQHYRNKAGTVTKHPVATTASTTSNPDSAAASTVSLGISTTNVRLAVTAADADDRNWVAVMTVYGADLE